MCVHPQLPMLFSFVPLLSMPRQSNGQIVPFFLSQQISCTATPCTPRPSRPSQPRRAIGPPASCTLGHVIPRLVLLRPPYVVPRTPPPPDLSLRRRSHTGCLLAPNPRWTPAAHTLHRRARRLSTRPRLSLRIACCYVCATRVAVSLLLLCAIAALPVPLLATVAIWLALGVLHRLTP